ncbi:MAG: porphobilinogen synthase [Candidatus Omnitrophica bacterium]|nr:porphobilinogen synthase [Candidatus Omnitrophota bacterium]
MIANRPGRIRRLASMRGLVRETTLVPQELVMPLFVKEGLRRDWAIPSMPGQFQHSLDGLLKEARRCRKAGVGAVMLFGIPARKHISGSGAFSETGIIPRALRRLKKEFPDLLLVADVCLCAYTRSGHCGLHVKNRLDKDATLAALARTALLYARSGADVVAPSDMMDGRVARIRDLLNAKGFSDTAILSYAVKYASAYYGPFRQAAENTPQSGDRRGYQMDPPNTDEALREAAADIEEGADLLLVKPALSYLDIVFRIKQDLVFPTGVYNVSGEYAMVKAAAAQGWINEKNTVLENLVSMKRAGADFIVSYWARCASDWLREGAY